MTVARLRVHRVLSRAAGVDLYFHVNWLELRIIGDARTLIADLLLPRSPPLIIATDVEGRDC